ncbi:hypothetical protein [Tenuibacillus multivorans]|uniref:hypothetical protein n=1 Tax=Tenuibacillus multivorans TaxID=237069 RepID=UPI000B889F7D|nr:hypothetical protein [Tenuibacillus multivorans]GEL78524.1 hypothetical protein TMU01_27590 [Tenuibacillus multivorans]
MNFVGSSAKNKWINQIKKSASEIGDRNDFSYIDRYIEDKRIILLGENSHGIGDYFKPKLI